MVCECHATVTGKRKRFNQIVNGWRGEEHKTVVEFLHDVCSDEVLKIPKMLCDTIDNTYEDGHLSHIEMYL